MTQYKYETFLRSLAVSSGLSPERLNEEGTGKYCESGALAGLDSNETVCRILAVGIVDVANRSPRSCREDSPCPLIFPEGRQQEISSTRCPASDEFDRRDRAAAHRYQLIVG